MDSGLSLRLYLQVIAEWCRVMDPLPGLGIIHKWYTLAPRSYSHTEAVESTAIAPEMARRTYGPIRPAFSNGSIYRVSLLAPSIRTCLWNLEKKSTVSYVTSP